ncbi:SPFH domain-containing protein, partial [Acinetobacter baumannii]
MSTLIQYWWLIALLIIIFTGLVTVNQGTIAVITLFGKYRRILRPGLNFKIPVLEQVYKTVS